MNRDKNCVEQWKSKLPTKLRRLLTSSTIVARTDNGVKRIWVHPKTLGDWSKLMTTRHNKIMADAAVSLGCEGVAVFNPNVPMSDEMAIAAMEAKENA